MITSHIARQQLCASTPASGDSSTIAEQNNDTPTPPSSPCSTSAEPTNTTTATSPNAVNFPLHDLPATHYRAGALLRVIGATTGCALSMREQAQRAMEDASYATHRDVRLGMLHGTEVQPAGHQPVSSYSPTKAVPAYASAMGKAILAFSSTRLVESMIEDGLAQCASFTANSVERLRKSLARIRLTRLAVSRGNPPNGKCAVAMPVFSGGSNVVAALEVDESDSSTDLRLVPSVLTVAARSLSRELVMTNTVDHPYLLVSSWHSERSCLEHSYRPALA